MFDKAEFIQRPHAKPCFTHQQIFRNRADHAAILGIWAVIPHDKERIVFDCDWTKGIIVVRDIMSQVRATIAIDGLFPVHFNAVIGKMIRLMKSSEAGRDCEKQAPRTIGSPNLNANLFTDKLPFVKIWQHRVLSIR